MSDVQDQAAERVAKAERINAEVKARLKDLGTQPGTAPAPVKARKSRAADE